MTCNRCGRPTPGSYFTPGALSLICPSCADELTKKGAPKSVPALPAGTKKPVKPKPPVSAKAPKTS